MKFTPRANTDDTISAPTWRLILFPAAMNIYPFELGLQLSNQRRLSALRAPPPCHSAMNSHRLNG
jgi:hypothetical protein